MGGYFIRGSDSALPGQDFTCNSRAQLTLDLANVNSTIAGTDCWWKSPTFSGNARDRRKARRAWLRSMGTRTGRVAYDGGAGACILFHDEVPNP